MKVRTLLVLLAMALPAAVATTPAGAASATAFVLTGSGTISPGLGVLPQGQSVSFTGTATYVRPDGSTWQYACSFSGNEIAGAFAAGFGTMSGGCRTWWCGAWHTFRAGVYQKWVCVDLTSTAPFGEMDCIWTPDDINPTTSFSLICAGSFAEIP